MANQTSSSWQTEVSELLARAARLSVEHGVDVDPFVRGAYSAYLDSRPGLREWLEEMKLRETLEEMRRVGRLPTA